MNKKNTFMLGTILLFFSNNIFAGGSYSIGLGYAFGDYTLNNAYEGDVAMNTIDLSYIRNDGSAWSIKLGESSGDLEGSVLDLELSELTITYSDDDYFMGFQSKDTTTTLPGAGTLNIYGFFVGTGQSTESGLFYSLSLAFLSSDISDQNDNVIQEGAFALGGSFGLGYFSSITENMNLKAEYKYQRYHIDWDSNNLGYDEWEELSTFGITLNYNL